MTNQINTLSAEIKAIRASMTWQACCMANEGKTSEQIDAATASKMARYEALNVEYAALMRAEFAAH